MTSQGNPQIVRRRKLDDGAETPPWLHSGQSVPHPLYGLASGGGLTAYHLCPPIPASTGNFVNPF